MREKFFLSCLLGVAALGAAPFFFSRPLHAQSPSAEETVVIPGFWDSKRRNEKPPRTGLGTVRFLTAPDYPPFDYLDASGELVGFNIDLAHALCTELELSCTIQARAWDTLLPALKENRGDAVMAGFAASAALRREFDLTDIYFKSPARFAERREMTLAVDPNALRNHKIGAIAGSAHAAYLNLYYGKAQIELFQSPEAAENALKNHDVDAIFGDGVQLALWLNSAASNNCCVFRGGPYLENSYFGEGQAIVVRKGQNQLRRLLNYGLQRIYEKGTYAELYLKWFPVSVF